MESPLVIRGFLMCVRGHTGALSLCGTTAQNSGLSLAVIRQVLEEKNIS